MDLPFFEEWLKEKRHLKPSSVQVYIQSIKKFLSFNPEIDDIEDYNKFIIDGAIKKRCNHYYSVLKNYIEFKIEDGGLKKRLIDTLVKPPLHHSTKRERRNLTEEQIFNVINSLESKKHRIIALIQSLTGVRAGDVLNLEVGGINPEVYEDEEVLRMNIIGKGGKRNVIYIHDKIAQQVIWDFILKSSNFSNYYFLEKGKMKNRPGTLNDKNRLVRMNYLWYWYDLKQALDAHGINKEDFASHDFRRCFARRVWEKWKDVHILQKILNHANPATTLRYLEQSGLQNIDYHKAMQS